MLGIIVLIAVLMTLGFMLAWITGVVAKEEIEVKTGVMVVVLTGIVNFAFGAFVTKDLGLWVGLLANAAVWLAVMTLLLRAIAGIAVKKGIVIALIYAVIVLLLNFGMASCVNAAVERHALTQPPRLGRV